MRIVTLSFSLLTFLVFQNSIIKTKTFFSPGNKFKDEHFHVAISTIMKSFPTDFLAIVLDNQNDVQLIENVIKELSKNQIFVVLFNITHEFHQDKYLQYLKQKYQKYEQFVTLFLCNPVLSEHMLVEIYLNEYIRKNLFFFFYWGNNKLRRSFQEIIHEAMRVVVITNPRPNAYRILYNQMRSKNNSGHKPHLVMVNWWNEKDGLSKRPSLPSLYETYKNFNGRKIIVPVLHKPPWFFVNNTKNPLLPCSNKEDGFEYDFKVENSKTKLTSNQKRNFHGVENEFLNVRGGRDYKLLRILEEKLNFRTFYCDPPQRIQEIKFNENSTSFGALGLIWKRGADLFLGDVALSAERFQVAEFSFIILADSGAFITHAPSKLNEALALIRPFQWQVWPVICVILILSGPILFALLNLSNNSPRTESKKKLLFECYWYSASLFLKQSNKFPFNNSKVRFFTILLSISATYIIADMYSANLTSLLAKPGRERAINNLYELEEAMFKKNYKLYVEKHSSSYNLLMNGTGVYNRLWTAMNDQDSFIVDSLEDGVIMVKESQNIAVLGGRETLFFDIQRFGANNFHLSQKLNTAYSAIAFQIGCPYVENFNSIIIALFEGGILAKMTENEYEKLGEKRSAVNEGTSGVIVPIGKKEARSLTKAAEDNEKLQPISLKMLQGAFYLLFFGSAFSTLILGLEILCYQLKLRSKTLISKKLIKAKKRIKLLFWKIILPFKVIGQYFSKKYKNYFNEITTEPLPYLD